LPAKEVDADELQEKTGKDIEEKKKEMKVGEENEMAA